MAAPPIWCTWCCTLTFDLEIMAVSEPPVKPKAKVTFSGKFHSHVYTIRTAWEQVAQAMWRRYPNPFSKHVLSEDTLSRSVEKGRLSSKRLLRKTNRGPKWIEKFVGGPGASACIVEESVVDAAAKTFTMYSRNIHFAKLMSVEEKCIYYVSPENENWTCCKKQAWIKCGVTGLSFAVERFGIERYKKNARKAELGLEYVIERLFFLPKILTSSSTSPTKEPS